MKGSNYRIRSGMPLTRKEYTSSPNTRIARFNTGNAKNDYDVHVYLTSTEVSQIRDNAIEAARVAANKKMSVVGETEYQLNVRVYPHVILSENKMIATAGADRLQEGMRRAYGKPSGLASRVKIGQKILEIRTFKIHIDAAKKAVKSAGSKLPMPSKVLIEDVVTPTK